MSHEFPSIRILRAQMAVEAWRRAQPGKRAEEGDARSLITDLMFLMANTGLDPEVENSLAVMEYIEQTKPPTTNEDGNER